MAGVGTTQQIFGDRYRAERLLGRGGMADVHRARDQRLGRDVAIKVLRSGPGLDRDRFAAEAEVLSSMRHPGIVALLDAGLDDDRPWFALELVEGRTLRDVMADGAPAPSLVAGVGAQVAAALAFAHDRGVIHRDVKPANVLLDGDGRARLADFGIARLADATSGPTLTGQTIGTAAYLAPEQVTGSDLSTAVDVYALGLVLLEWFTGRREYAGSPIEAAVARLHRQPTIPASLPSGWSRVLLAMTALDPGQRPTASAVVADLTSLADGQAVPDDGTAPLSVPLSVLTPMTTATSSSLPTSAETPSRPAARAISRRAVVAVVAAGVALAAILMAGLPGGEEPPAAAGADGPTVASDTPGSAAAGAATDLTATAWKQAEPSGQITRTAPVEQVAGHAKSGKAKGKGKGKAKRKRGGKGRR